MKTFNILLAFITIALNPLSMSQGHARGASYDDTPLDLGQVRIQGFLEERIIDPNTGKIKINSEQIKKEEMLEILEEANLDFSYRVYTPSLTELWVYLNPLKESTKHKKLPRKMIKVDNSGEVYFQDSDDNNMVISGAYRSAQLRLGQSLLRDEFACETYMVMLQPGLKTFKCIKEVKLPLISKLEQFKTHFNTHNVGELQQVSFPCEIGTDVDLKNILKVLRVRETLCRFDKKDCGNMLEEVSQLVKDREFSIYNRRSAEILETRIDKIQLFDDNHLIKFFDKDNRELLTFQSYDRIINYINVPNCGYNYKEN